MNRLRGFTLVELMVGITVGLIVILGATQLYVDLFRANSEGVRLQRFQQVSHVLLSNMVMDIRKAGYDNPLVAGVLSSADFDSADSVSNCLRFSYEDNVTDGTGKRRYLGYQLLGGVFYFYKTDVAANKAACGSATNWTPITGNMEIVFSPPSGGTVFEVQGGQSVEIRFVATSSSLKLSDGQTELARESTALVHVRNADPVKNFCPDAEVGEECES